MKIFAQECCICGYQDTRSNHCITNYLHAPHLKVISYSRFKSNILGKLYENLNYQMDIIPEIPWTVILPELSLIASKIFLCPSYWDPVSDIPSQWLPPIDQGHYWYQYHGVAFFWLLFRGIQHQQPCYHYYREYEEKTNKQNIGLNFKKIFIIWNTE